MDAVNKILESPIVKDGTVNIEFDTTSILTLCGALLLTLIVFSVINTKLIK